MTLSRKNANLGQTINVSSSGIGDTIFVPSSGYVGINKNNPLYNLDVVGTGNFSQNLMVNGTGVSLSGHNHLSSNITDFNSSVSGLLPTISNSGDNRLLTSTGSSVGVNAESNATFDGTSLVISGDVAVDNLKLDGNTLSSTSGNIIVSPSGTGALQRDSGGNARGQYAVDWQTVRSTSTMVAAGSYSVIGGGRNNTSSGLGSTIGGGRDNISSSTQSTVGGGRDNVSSAFHSTVAGGRSNTSSSNYSTIGGGIFNTASAYCTVVCGGAQNTASNYYTAIVGGRNNTNSGSYSVIGGGTNNVGSGNYGAILGGTNNQDNGYDNVFILGSNIAANKANTTFVNDLSVGGSGNFASGLYVSGTGVSLSGHVHISSDISNFNSSVSGLLPITNIVAGSNVDVTTSGTIYTISVNGLTTSYKNVSSSANLLPSDETIFAYCDSSNITLTMPSASGVGGKKMYLKKVSGSFNLIIQPLGSQKIDNTNSTILSYINESVTLISDNNNWFVF